MTIADRVLLIFQSRNPFKIFDTIVHLIKVFMIDFRPVIWIRNIRYTNKAMHQRHSWFSFGIIPHHFITLRMALQLQKTLRLMTPKLPIFSGRVLPFKPRYIFHKYARGTTAWQKSYPSKAKLVIKDIIPCF